jgi:hypothetical protein
LSECGIVCMILLPHPPECWDYKWTPPCPSRSGFLIVGFLFHKQSVILGLFRPWVWKRNSTIHSIDILKHRVRLEQWSLLAVDSCLWYTTGTQLLPCVCSKLTVLLPHPPPSVENILVDWRRFFFFYDTGIWTKGLILAKQVFYHLRHTMSP